MLALIPVSFLPCCNGVTARRYIFERISPVFFSHRVRTFYDDEVSVHPGMDIALHGNGYFRGFPALHDGRGTRGLRAVPGNIPGHGVGLRMDIVRRLVAGNYFVLLPDIHSENVG